MIENLIKKEDISLSDEISLPAPANTSQAQGSNKIVLNSTSEFCRSLGEIPTYGLAGNREEEREEIMVSNSFCLFFLLCLRQQKGCKVGFTVTCICSVPLDRNSNKMTKHRLLDEGG